MREVSKFSSLTNYDYLRVLQRSEHIRYFILCFGDISLIWTFCKGLHCLHKMSIDSICICGIVENEWFYMDRNIKLTKFV